MAPRERGLDPRLGGAQKVERAIEFVLVDLAQVEHRPQRVRRGRLTQLARGRELGRRLEHPRHHQRQGQARQPLGSARQEPLEAELAGHAEHRGDMAVRQGAQDLQPRRRRVQRLALEHPAQRLDLGLRPAREIGERARLDLGAGAIALAQEDRRR
jgi:hypothetical protein